MSTRYYNPETGRFLNADALASTGQGILGNNMFAYCSNAPVDNYDPTGNYYASVEDRITTGCGGRGGMPVAKPTYIDSQYTEGIGNQRLGVTNVSHGGCGVVASYNTLLDLDVNREFKYVLNDYNSNLGSKLFFGGLAGITPNSVARYFRKLGYEVISTDDFQMIDALSSTADGCILYYSWDSNALVPPYYAHFISYRTEGEGYLGYNINGQTQKFTSPSAFVEEKQGKKAIGIFIFK